VNTAVNGRDLTDGIAEGANVVTYPTGRTISQSTSYHQLWLTTVTLRATWRDPNTGGFFQQRRGTQDYGIYIEKSRLCFYRRFSNRRVFLSQY